MACSPATPTPITNTRPGASVPAAVIIIGISFGQWLAPSSTALYPARLAWLLSTSIAWARLIRGTNSSDSSDTCRSAAARTRSCSTVGESIPTSTAPSRIRRTWSTAGGPSVTTRSASSHARCPAWARVAPAWVNVSSLWKLPPPSPGSIVTSSPAATSFLTTAGVRGVRVSSVSR